MDTASPVAIRTVPQPNVVAVAEPRGARLTVTIFVIALVAIVASAIVIGLQFADDDGAVLWFMVAVGTVVIAVLLFGVFMPFIKEVRHHRLPKR